ncbi:hypothetical protein FH972_006984 [Carpinus fangiana]|uniref:DNA-directed RNA polymerase III subunit RPC9 n=1 Tax=Carpinus fangiana TaxID=176857 RepID=A0A5N6QX85_9ROSI|nr:hypothetical protein FH972_006984 [Carpinus fangiana]
MKILAANAGTLTNFEVLDFLRSKGAAKDPTRVLASVAPSEYKVYDYLVKTAACNQTKENIKEFSERCKKFDLAKAEVLNIINMRPSSAVGVYPIIEQCAHRFEDVEELVELVTTTLPPPPTQPESEGEKTQPESEGGETQAESKGEKTQPESGGKPEEGTDE